MSEFLCMWLPVFRLQASAGRMPKEAAIATEREGPLELVAAANPAACAAGICVGMAVPQAQGRCPGATHWPCSSTGEHALAARIKEAADRISPRVQVVAPDLLILDFAGLERLHGSAELAARRLNEAFACDGIELRTGIAAQPATALMAARSRIGRMIVGQEAKQLAPLPVTLLSEVHELIRSLATEREVGEMLLLLERWGIRTLGALAALPSAALSSRLGKLGAHLQSLARGEVAGILDTPLKPDLTLSRTSTFDPPVHDLEIIKAVIAREALLLAEVLEQHDHVVEQLELRLTLESKKPEVLYLRLLSVPTREGKALVAQVHLDLDRDPPEGDVECFQLTFRVARPTRIQTRLFSAASPDRAKMPKLLARLSEIFHDCGHDRVGSPRLLDTHRPEAFEIHPFAPPDAENAEITSSAKAPQLALRVFRPPQELRDQQARIIRRAGPWRSTGGWWRECDDAAQWACDEWDAEMATSSGQIGLYRLLHDLTTRRWYILGRYD